VRADAIEASVQLSEAVLVDVGVPVGPAIASIHEKRASLQATIKAMGAGRQGAPIGTSAAARPIVVGQCQLI